MFLTCIQQFFSASFFFFQSLADLLWFCRLLAFYLINFVVFFQCFFCLCSHFILYIPTTEALILLFFSSSIFCSISLFANICLFHVHILFGNCVSSSYLLVNFCLLMKIYFHQFVSLSLLSSFFFFLFESLFFPLRIIPSLFYFLLFLFSNSSMFLVSFSFNSSHYTKCHSSSFFS
jgi:hypothetical protein